MLQNINGVEEIVGFFKGWLEKHNGQYTLARIFGMAQRYEANQLKEDEIEKIANLSRGEYVVETTILDDSMAIVTFERNEGDSKVRSYQPVVNGRRCYDVADTFDYALAIALGHKYNVSSFAPQAIHNILQMDKFEQKNRPKTFVERVVLGEITIDQIDDAIEEWHKGQDLKMELNEYLGLTLYEYQEAVLHNKKEVLQNIIDLQNSHNKKS